MFSFSSRTPVTVLLGPTASGKSGKLAPLLKESGWVYVGCDSRHLYSELTIGSTRPTAQEMGTIPLFCVGGASIREKIDAARYAELAKEATENALRNQQRVVVTGGSAFYFLAVARGLAPKAPSDSTLRERWNARYDHAPHDVYAECVRRDPALVSRIHKSDKYRVVRALEVMDLTGEVWSELQKKTKSFQPWAEAEITILDPAPEVLRQHIRERTRAMLEAGLVEETRGLLAQGFTGEEPGFQSIGYQEVLEGLRNTKLLVRELLEEKIALATWHYARKQRTFFRSLAKQLTSTGFVSARTP